MKKEIREKFAVMRNFKVSKEKLHFAARHFTRFYAFAASLLLLCFSVAGQTGGTFQIEQSAIAAGGGANSGGIFSLDATAGQTIAGERSQNLRFSVQNGFWTSNFVPTAAQVLIGGRITTFDGRGIQNVRVTLSAPDGTTRQTQTGSFGKYRFDSVAVGETYVLTVFSQRFIFSNPTRIITVNDERGDLDFTAEQ